MITIKAFDRFLVIFGAIFAVVATMLIAYSTQYQNPSIYSDTRSILKSIAEAKGLNQNIIDSRKDIEKIRFEMKQNEAKTELLLKEIRSIRDELNRQR